MLVTQSFEGSLELDSVSFYLNLFMAWNAYWFFFNFHLSYRRIRAFHLLCIVYFICFAQIITLEYNYYVVNLFVTKAICMFKNI